MEETALPKGLDPDVRRREIVVEAHGVHLGKMHHRVDVDSPEDPALIAALVHNARGGCYAEAAIAQPVPIEASAQLNDRPLDLDAHRKRPPRGGGS